MSTDNNGRNEKVVRAPLNLKERAELLIRDIKHTKLDEYQSVSYSLDACSDEDYAVINMSSITEYTKEFYLTLLDVLQEYFTKEDNTIRFMGLDSENKIIIIMR